MTIAQAGATLNRQGLGGLTPFLSSAFALNNAALGFAYGAIYLGSMLRNYVWLVAWFFIFGEGVAPYQNL